MASTGYTSFTDVRPAPRPAGTTELAGDAQQQLARQSEAMRQQDAGLASLARSMDTLENLGTTINGELRTQSTLLDDLGRGVDQTQGALAAQTSSMSRLIKTTKKHCKYYVILMCLVLVLVVLLCMILGGAI